MLCVRDMEPQGQQGALEQNMWMGIPGTWDDGTREAPGGGRREKGWMCLGLDLLFRLPGGRYVAQSLLHLVLNYLPTPPLHEWVTVGVCCVQCPANFDFHWFW